MKLVIACGALCSLLLAGTAAAQTTPTAAHKQQLQQRLKAADANGDGLISRSEADASLPRIAKRFDALDGNRDGQLSPDELRAAMQAMQQAKQREP
ncbi:EF-hand domain-containing protein [Xanthomonas bonasiae]|uniref:EF-hand domain-containing protein n=1 Tax=Xanthomonas bonasiae TaxID=2810351 RepID=UPI00198147DE|nr:EF-hand domain-containing protein [Xanthomonas bonasiae]MBN6113541.1 EF-hand domain-containing protein [Xanthomonas bonasiae]